VDRCHVRPTDEIGDLVELSAGADVEVIRVRHQDHDRAKSEQRYDQAEISDAGSRVEDRFPRGCRVLHREKPHEYVRKAGGAEYKRESERYCRNGFGEQSARRENCRSLRVNLARLDEKTSEVEVKMPEYHQAHQGAARQQQDGLGNLHPGGCLHSANRDIDDHQDANAGDCIDIVNTKKELNELFPRRSSGQQGRTVRPRGYRLPRPAAPKFDPDETTRHRQT
jgi:hypothetical protein